MCRPATCKTCGKTTWAGCGQHVATVRAGVPTGQWCPGTHTPAEHVATSQRQRGFWKRLLRS